VETDLRQYGDRFESVATYLRQCGRVDSSFLHNSLLNLNLTGH